MKEVFAELGPSEIIWMKQTMLCGERNPPHYGKAGIIVAKGRRSAMEALLLTPPDAIRSEMHSAVISTMHALNRHGMR